MVQVPEGYPDETEFHMRFALALPAERKVEIARQLKELAESRGAACWDDIWWYLDAELDFLVHMLGKTFPISEADLTEAMILLFLSCGKSADEIQVVRFPRDETYVPFG